MTYAAVPPILADDSKRRKNLDLDLDDRVALGFFSFTSKPSVSAVLFGFHGINLFKNLVSRDLLRILENFHFSISISKHFDFTFHFSKKSESILFSLCNFSKKSESIFFTLHLSKKSASFYFSLFTSRTFQTHSRRGLQ